MIVSLILKDWVVRTCHVLSKCMTREWWLHKFVLILYVMAFCTPPWCLMLLHTGLFARDLHTVSTTVKGSNWYTGHNSQWESPQRVLAKQGRTQRCFPVDLLLFQSIFTCFTSNIEWNGNGCCASQAQTVLTLRLTSEIQKCNCMDV